jgi:sugar-specific transcriptional regulator TrmB
MGDELIEKLELFGLTQNQASVYAAVVKSGCSSISQIAEATGIHPQDICKITIKLEEKGLVTRTFSKPLVIEALPVKIALENFLESEKQKQREKMKQLESFVMEIQKSLNRRHIITESKREVAPLMLLPFRSLTSLATYPVTENKIVTAFENIKTKYELVASSKDIIEGSENLSLFLARMPQRSKYIEVRILVILPYEKTKKRILQEECKITEVAEQFRRSLPKTTVFDLRSLREANTETFAIIDSKEVWFGLHVGEKQYILVGGEELVEMANREFELFWNSPKARSYLKTNSFLPYEQQEKNDSVAIPSKTH